MLEILIISLTIASIILFCISLEIADNTLSRKKKDIVTQYDISNRNANRGYSKLYMELHKKAGEDRHLRLTENCRIDELPERQGISDESYAAMQIDYLTNNGITPSLAEEIISYVNDTKLSRSENDNIKLNRIMNELLHITRLHGKKEKPLS